MLRIIFVTIAVMWAAISVAQDPVDAILNHDYETVKTLVARKYDVNTFDDNGYTPIMYASDVGDNDICKLLMDNGADPNQRPLYDNEPPALIAAVLANFPETVDILLQYERTDIEIVDSLGRTALYHAAKNGFSECVDVLLFHGANPNHAISNGTVPLHIASNNGDTTIAGMLLRYNADINVKNKKQRTPFSVSVENNDMQMMKFLKEHGANVNAGSTAFIAAAFASDETFDYLVAEGVDMDTVDAGMYSTKDVSIMMENHSVTRKLARAGVKSSSALLIRYLSVSFDNEFCKHEYRMGLTFGVHENRINTALYFGFSGRPVDKPALVESDMEHLFYQLREKRTILNFGIEKRFAFNQNRAMPSWGAYVGYQLSYCSGKYDGSLDLKPESQAIHVPCVGLYGRFRWIGMSAGYKYYGYKDMLEAPKNVVNINLTGYFGLMMKKYKKFSR